MAGVAVQNWICLILFRVLLPLVLLFATVIRFNMFSFVYGCLMLLAPLLKRPTHGSMQSHTGRYLTASVVICSLTLLSQIIFQVYVGTGDRGLGNCSETELILYHVGLQKMTSDVLASVGIIVPDIAAFVVCLSVFICCRLLLRRQQQHSNPSDSAPPFTSRLWPARYFPAVFDYFAKFITLVGMTLAGILRPSIIGSTYFVCVIVSVTVWSVFIRLHQCWFQRLRFFLLFYSALHLVAVYIIQLPYTQSAWLARVGQNGTAERLIGLTRFVDVNCTSDTILTLRLDLPWNEYINILVVVFFYLILAGELRRCRRKGPKGRTSKAQDPAVDSKINDSPGSLLSQDTQQKKMYSEPSVSFKSNKRESSDFGSVIIGIDTDTDDVDQTQSRTVLTSAGMYLMLQSYIGTLIIMMAWSIAYHSWLTFIFLLGACFIWILPQKQKVCLRCSPVIVFYAICLLVLQYIYALDLTDEELPIVMSNSYELQEIGLVKYENPAAPLGIKIGFTCMFWLTLRQFCWQRCQRRKPKTADRIPLRMISGKNNSDGEAIKAAGEWMWHKLCKYWILACAALFLVIALREAVIFRIVYMALFLVFVITFQLSYRIWRMCIQGFWWFVIIYSMVVLGCIYTYQFEGFPGLWQNHTGMSPEMLSNLGLRKFDTTTLFLQLLTPTSFLIVIIMQLHYFQKTFLFISDLNRFQKKEPVDSPPPEPESGEQTDFVTADTTSVRRKAVRRTNSRRRHGIVAHTWKHRLRFFVFFIGNKLLFYADAFSSVIWRFLEIHMFKFVVITIFLCCVLEVNVLNTVLVLFVLILLPFEQTQQLISTVCLIWSSIVLLLKMVYQLDTISLNLFVSNCSMSSMSDEWIAASGNSTNVSATPSGPRYDSGPGLTYPFNDTIDSSTFAGLQRKSHLASYVMIYILMIVMLVVEAIVKYHQIQYYNHPDRTQPMPGILFADVKWSNADSGLKECCMFLANYTFYKYGKELCFTMTMITMVVRLDVFSVLYGLFLGILLLLPRSSCRSVWPVYIAVLMIFLLLQYLSCLGMPPALCWEYPWTSNWAMTSNLKTYLFLPSYTHSLRSHKLIADFFQLLLVCLQRKAFWLEKEKLKEYGGGPNYSIIKEVEMGRRNPHGNDFTSYKNSYLDYLKMVVFFWSFWLTLMIVLISGMSRISLFCMGYLIGCFVFLWFGEEMLLKPLRKLIQMWMGLLFYCYIVLLAKCCLQLVGCVYTTNVNPSYCWIIQLLNIVCLQSTYYEQPVNTPCQLSRDEAGLSWDAVCFVFLLFMVRVFKSWYFQHVVTELTVRNKFAARGAELINQNLIEEVERLKRTEDDVLIKIKQKMERIKERHRRCLQKKAEAVVEPNDHYLVIRSGDYYMFEDMTDEEEENEEMDFGISQLDHGPANVCQVVVETPDWRAKKPSIGPIAMINAAILGGAKEAVNLAVGRTSRFSHQTSRRSSSAQEYSTPDNEPHPSSPTSAPYTVLSSDGASDYVDVSATTELISSTPSEQSSVTKDITGSKISPRKPGAFGRTDTIEPVAEEGPSDGEDDVFDGKDETKSEKNKDDAVVSGLNFIRVFAGSLLDSLTAFMYDLSRKYRSISRVLEAEKQQEKLRRKPPTGSLLHFSESGPNEEVDSASSIRPFTNRRKNNHKRFEENITALKTAEKDFHTRMPRLLRLMIAILEALMSRTDLLCYFVMVLNVLLSASILSILFPISIFFWGMLSVPRPTKTYWITVITYTEAIIVLKYLFQFNFFPWNIHHLPSPPLFWLPRVIGIEKKEMYAALDFFLLFCLFLHRMVLKSHGLWKDAKALNADLKDVEVKRSSVPGSPESSHIKYSQSASLPTVTVGSSQLEPMASPQPTRENIVGSTNVDDLAESGDCVDTVSKVAENLEEQEKQESRGKLFCSKLFQPVYDFFSHMVNPRYSAVTDVYAFMFACDLVTFLIVVFGYSSFGPTSVEGADVATVLQQSRVPVPFLAMLLVQFVLIIIDRALYLRKLVFGKFIFHIFLVILVHIWIFFLLPAITDRAFTSNVAAQLWYFFKCVYFALSCYQIRSGYPMRILGNFLTKNYSYVNLFCFKGFLAVPFLLELRALMDWMWTDTTLALTSWLQMEDIYANIFVLKCWRKAEATYPTPRGLPRSAVVKYGLGGLILIVLVFIIWFPLLLFSLSGSIFNANPPVVVDLEIKISGYQSIFSMTAQYEDIEKLKSQQYEELKTIFDSDLRAQVFLMTYRDEDVYEVRIRGTSASTWEISLPSERHLHEVLSVSEKISLLTTVTVRREPMSGSLSVPTVVGSFETLLNRSNPDEKQVMETLAAMIDGAYHLNVTIPHMFPRYITVPSQKRLNESRALFNQNISWSSVQLSLHQDPVRRTRWWQVQECITRNMSRHNALVSVDEVYDTSSYPIFNPYLTIITFNERIPTGVFSVLNNYGVIGLYVSVILVIGRLLRMQTVGNIQNIMFTDLPFVDRIHRLCKDIYLARQAGELPLEEFLFSKLNFLYRSPETIIKWTRRPKEKTE